MSVACMISVRVLRLSHNDLMNYSWCIYCWRYCTTCQCQTTATCRGAWLLALAPTLSNWVSETLNSALWLLHCTVQFLKYVPMASIIGRQVWEHGLRDLWWGSLLQCSRKLERAYILGPFIINQYNFFLNMSRNENISSRSYACLMHRVKSKETTNWWTVHTSRNLARFFHY